MVQILTSITFAFHILGGAVSMAAGLIALCARKGGRLHRTAGDVFVIAMLVMAVFAAALGVIRPGQIVNVFIAGFTPYLVATAWLTARRGDADDISLVPILSKPSKRLLPGRGPSFFRES